MPWTYSQKTGTLTHNGKRVGDGYSGKKGAWRDNPRAETVKNRGPIPRGQYRIGPPRLHREKGPITMTLTPVGHLAHGRTAFLIHGDSVNNPGDASEGCIVLGRAFRERVAASGDGALNVVE